ncbi:MAG: IgGFc-binding protein [Defluviitaleaceae bacterium]|nr:IgGFc-binding protein [Defluviitaleaceae bacterium]
MTHASVDLQIRIVGGNVPATGTIHFTQLGTSIPFSVPANGVFTHVLNDAQKIAVYNNTAGITNRSVRITTSTPVMVFALNQAGATTDATNVLPITALGTEYYMISGRPSNTATHMDAYGVVATEDNTRLYVEGTFVGTLNAGQTYYYMTSTNIDITGTHITSDKPVAFFSLRQGSNMGGSTNDHFFQQLAPVHTWGRTFFAPVGYMGRNFVRIVASQDGTNITQIGGTVLSTAGAQTTLTNLQAGQWVELEILLANNGAFIEANHPVGVCVFLPSSGAAITAPSDPSIAWLPALGQFVNSGLITPFIPSGNTQLNQHHALIVTPTATRYNTTLSIGGAPAAPISGGTWRTHSSGFSFYMMQLHNLTASYFFTNPAGLIVLGYGTGSVESYYYVAVSGMRTLDVAFFANDVHNQDLITHAFNTNDINFRAAIEGVTSSDPGHIKWFIDGVEDVSLRDQLTWSRNFPNGTYLIEMEVLGFDNVTVRRVEGTLVIGVFIIVNPHIRKTNIN